MGTVESIGLQPSRVEQLEVGPVESLMPPRKLSIDRARTFCKVLRADTDGQPMRWRGIGAIADRAGLKDPAVAVAVAVDQGWLELEGGHSVMLTEKGRRL